MKHCTFFLSYHLKRIATDSKGPSWRGGEGEGTAAA